MMNKASPFALSGFSALRSTASVKEGSFAVERLASPGPASTVCPEQQAICLVKKMKLLASRKDSLAHLAGRRAVTQPG